MEIYSEETSQAPQHMSAAGVGGTNPFIVTDNFMQYRLDSSDIIEEILHYLRGEVWDPKHKNYVKKYERLCNDDGINAIASVLYSHLNKNIYTSDLEEEDINRIAREIRIAIAMLVSLYYHEFGIDEKYRKLIILEVDHQVYAALRRALEGGERNLIGRSVTRVETVQQLPERKSLFSIFKPRI